MNVVTRPIRPRHAVKQASLPSIVPYSTKPTLIIVTQKLVDLKSPARKVRRALKGQIRAAADTITRFGFIPPFLVTGTGDIIDRPEFVAACQLLEIDTVPTIVVDGLSQAEVKALRLALLKVPERAEWDIEALAAELEDLFAIDPALIPYTGFTMPEVDIVMSNITLDGVSDDEESCTPTGPVVSRLGDLWLFASGGKLLFGSARDPASYPTLLGTEKVQMVLADPPFGCSIKGHVSRKHRDFVEGSGMSEPQAMEFFHSFLNAMTPHLIDGAIVDLFIDAGGMFPLMHAIRNAGLVQKTLVTWDKGAGGMGSLYRQQAEYVLISKWGDANHINNIELGKHGRNRTTIWSAPGLAQFGKGRKEALKLHPTVKPIGLLVDALLDTSLPGGIVLDPFAGSGSTLVAAHRTKRLGRAIELDPAYVDVAIARMEKLSGQPATHSETGLTFKATAERRHGGAPPSENANAGLRQVQK